MTTTIKKAQRMQDLSGESEATILRLRWSKFWDKASPWIVSILAVLFVISVIGNFLLEYDANRSQNNHHAQTAKQQTEIINLIKEVQTSQEDHAQTLSEVATLQKEFSDDVAAGVIKLGAGQTVLLNQFAWLDCAVASSAAACGPAPPTS